eukprot:m.16288 g.16288  ORF g.16288 m.16288 type:complete len:159 (+) comp10937_c0_seq1:155-631(+)
MALTMFGDFSDFADPFSLLRGHPSTRQVARRDRDGPRFGAMDIHEVDGGHEIVIDAPGLGKGDYKIDVTPENVLRVSGERTTSKSSGDDGKDAAEDGKGNGRVTRWQERTYTSFSRSVQLPAEADVKNIKANARDGVLTVNVPSTPRPEPMAVDVEHH